MGDIAFVPQGDVLKTGLSIGAHHSRQAADLLKVDGVAFVGHGRGAFLLFTEVLLSFTNFGALQMPDFSSDLVERTGYDSQGGQIVCMPVALNHLGRDGGS